jgi:hypothetical protein
MIFLPILNALFILGLYKATQEDGPLSFIREFMDKWGMRHHHYGGMYNDPLSVPTEAKTWYYPVLYCPVCMSSLWGTVGFSIALVITGAWSLAWLLPFHVLATYGAVYWLQNQMYD